MDEDLIKALSNLTPEQKEAIKNILTTHEPKKRGRPKKIKEVVPNIHDNIPKGNGRPTAIANFQTGPRPNKFIGSRDFSTCKGDSEIDKLLWKGRKPADRDRPQDLVKSTCRKCGNQEEVHSIYAQKDEENRRLYHICNSCIGKE